MNANDARLWCQYAPIKTYVFLPHNFIQYFLSSLMWKAALLCLIDLYKNLISRGWDIFTEKNLVLGVLTS